jgi:hypothetical protein
MRHRLESLEDRARHNVAGRSSGARHYMREHLEQVARLRRGELGPEEVAEVEAKNDAVESRLAQIRGEGSR